jgi:hypothetical protein
MNINCDCVSLNGQPHTHSTFRTVATVWYICFFILLVVNLEHSLSLDLYSLCFYCIFCKCTMLRTGQENSQEICQLITIIFIIYKLLSLIFTNKYFTQKTL